jgi:adenine-specific DNA methylase
MTFPADNQRLIDQWFPCAAVDDASGNPAGSGRNEKAIFPWFASRPIAQARAAVACALLGDDPAIRPTVDEAVRGSRGAIDTLAKAVAARYPTGQPVVLDVFSGRGIIPLEAARLGAVAVGLDLSPVATLAGRILADYPLRDWSAEPPLPWTAAQADGLLPIAAGRSRLITDLELLFTEIGDRLRAAVAPYYPTIRPSPTAAIHGVTCGRSAFPVTAVAGASRWSAAWCCAIPTPGTVIPGRLCTWKWVQRFSGTVIRRE